MNLVSGKRAHGSCTMDCSCSRRYLELLERAQVGQVARDSHVNAGDGDLAALVEGLGTGEDGDAAAAGLQLVQDDTVIVTAGRSMSC